MRPPAGQVPSPSPLRRPRACAPQVSGRPPAARRSHLRPRASQKGRVGGRAGEPESSPLRTKCSGSQDPEPGRPGQGGGVEGDSKERGVGRVTSLSRCRDRGTEWHRVPSTEKTGGRGQCRPPLLLTVGAGWGAFQRKSLSFFLHWARDWETGFVSQPQYLLSSLTGLKQELNHNWESPRTEAHEAGDWGQLLGVDVAVF